MQYTSHKVYEYISKQTNDPIVEWKTCAIAGVEFPIYKSDLDFYAKVSRSLHSGEGGVGGGLPTPTLCPEERQRRRMTRKNDHYYFRRICDFSGESAVSIYHPSVPGPVYKVAYRWSDKRDAKTYARTYDPSQSIFHQYKELHNTVPKIAMVNDNGVGSENCEYCQNVAYSKDCYLNTVSRKLKDCYYSSNMATGELLIDSFFTMDSQICYECVEGYNLYECFYLSKSDSCTKCFVGYELHGCTDCVFCVGLTNKQYCIYNKQYSKEEFQQLSQIIRNAFVDNPNEHTEEYEKLLSGFEKNLMHIIGSEYSYGNNLVNCDHTILSYNLKNATNCKYRWFGDTGSNAQDLTVGGELELCYEGIVPDKSFQTGFSVFCWSCDNVRYSEMCHNCKNCFACIGLKNQEYCILNKQYTSKEKYEEEVKRIIEHMQKDGSWGEFFPSSLSPFAYNHTIAQDYFPSTKEDVNISGLSRIDEDTEFNVIGGMEVIEGKTMNRNPVTMDDDILKKAIRCVESGRLFRIIPKELEFYRKYLILLPVKHPLYRYRDRLKAMPTKQLVMDNNTLTVSL